MIDFTLLRHFAKSEFDHPRELQPAFLLLLDNIRDIADIPFYVTSDYRTPDENKRVGGSSTSLHMQGAAVDFVVSPWNAAVLWKVVRAVALVEVAYSVTFELKLGHGPSNRHIHLGLQKSGAGELILVFERAS